MSTIYKDLVEVNGFVFNSPTPIYYDFRIDEIAGWDSGPDLDVVVSDYGVADGGTPAFFPAKSKYMQIEGYVTFGSRLSGEDVKTALGNAFPRNVDLTLKRYSPIPKQMTVRRASKIEYPQDLPQGLRFVLTVVAPDPFRYSVDEQILNIGISTPDESGRIYPRVYPLIYLPIAGADTGNLGLSFNNVGNAPFYPITYVNGPLTAGGWQLINETTGQRLTFDVSLLDTQILKVDHANHTLELNGYPYAARPEGEWWAILPGDNFLRLTSSDYNATAQMSVHARSAWE